MILNYRFIITSLSIFWSYPNIKINYRVVASKVVERSSNSNDVIIVIFVVYAVTVDQYWTLQLLQYQWRLVQAYGSDQ